MSHFPDSFNTMSNEAEDEENDSDRTQSESSPKAAYNNRNRITNKAQQDLTDNVFWRRTSVSKEEFYAAAFCLEIAEPRHCWTQPGQDDDRAREPDGQLLDGLAHFFARSKNMTESESHISSGSSSSGSSGTRHKNKGKGAVSSKKARKGVKSKTKNQKGEELSESEDQNEELSPVDHVTATALGSEYKEEGQTYRKIYIAKNGGADRKDRKIANQLESWYNRGNVQKPSQEHPMWKPMQNFWIQRHRHSSSKISRERMEWLSRRTKEPSRQVLAFATRLNEPEDTTSFEADFRKDWDHIHTLFSKWPANSRYFPDTDIQMNAFINRVCFDDSEKETWRLSYRKVTGTAEEPVAKLIERFRILVKHFKRLKTISSVLNAFCMFHHQQPETKIKFVFLPKKDLERSRRPFLESIRSLIAEWKPTDEGNRYWKKLSGAEKMVFQMCLRRKFHCELQLLEIEGDEFNNLPSTKGSGERRKERIHPYFGCSKLSCFLCWSILKKLDYSTKNTHGKLRANCGFPFSAVDNFALMRIQEVIEEVQTRLKDNIGRSPSETFNDDKSISDTATFYVDEDRTGELDKAGENDGAASMMDSPNSINSSDGDQSEDLDTHDEDVFGDDDFM